MYQHHEMPTSGRALNAVALSGTLHCLTGCAIGEVLGMVIGTALGLVRARRRRCRGRPRQPLAHRGAVAVVAFVFGVVVLAAELLG